MNAKNRKGPAIDRAIQSLQRLTELFERRRAQLAREVGLTDPQWRVLEEIARDEFMPSLFARARDAHPTAVSRTLRQLQDRDLVSASISSADARQREYEVTARGRRLLERLRTSRERAIDAVWAGLPARDLDRFAAFSQRLADRLDAYAREREAGEAG
ncbi:MAG: MarR family winged helix-turn-helix transcriptional regulator [Myxococcota bacterium]